LCTKLEKKSLILFRKGALVLLSRDFVNKNQNSQSTNRLNANNSSSLNDNLNLKVNDLRRNILYYGMQQEKQNNRDNKTKEHNNNNHLNRIKKSKQKNELNNFSSTTNLVSDSNFLYFLTASTKELFINSSSSEEKENQNSTSTLKALTASSNHEINMNSNQSMIKRRVNRGFSARRYLRILTKNWDQDLLEKFLHDGKIKHESLFEKKSERSFNNRKRKLLDDDLSLWPQSYRFDSNANLIATFNLRKYKFLRVQEYGIARRINDEKRKYFMMKHENIMEKNETAFDNADETEVLFENLAAQNQIEQPNRIKIFDDNSNEIDYKNMDITKKEEVLAEILFQCTLKNIQNQNLV
jgi:hypothetical protein